MSGISDGQKLRGLGKRYREMKAKAEALELKLRDADAMARVIDRSVKNGKFDSRSAIADARLNYGQPFVYEWSDA